MNIVKRLSRTEAKMLFAEAKQASFNSYSPYSHFSVGAAVLTKCGNIYRGTNVENASYGLTICAERAAIFNAIVNGAKDIMAIAIYGDHSNVSPCGACRQVILEFGADIDVVFEKEERLVVRKSSSLVPEYFDKRRLIK